MKRRIQLFLEEGSYFLKDIFSSTIQDIKKTVSNPMNYVYIFVLLAMYNLIFRHRGNLTLLLVIVSFIFFFHAWQDGNWRGKMRKEKYKKYFSSPHPDKEKNLKPKIDSFK